MQKLKSQNGQALSVFELCLVVGIIIMLVFWLFVGSDIILNYQKRGNDNLRENTCESVAMVESNNGMNCPLDGRSDTCPHYTSNGYVSYYDDISNTLVESKPYGYNDYNVMKIGNQKYYGPEGSMVIKVYCQEGHIQYSWEIGKQ